MMGMSKAHDIGNMATMTCFLPALVLLALLHLVVSQMGMPKPNKPLFAPNEADLKYAACSVCQHAVQHLVQGVLHDKQEAKEKGKEWTEEGVFGVIEHVCDPEYPQGSWIRTYDLIEQENSQLTLERVADSEGTPLKGHCKNECATIAKSCRQLTERYEVELEELLWRESSAEAVEKMLCHKKARVCRPSKLKELAKRSVSLAKSFAQNMTQSVSDPTPGSMKKEQGKASHGRQAFEPLTADERERDDMMEKMKGIPGMPGMSMYSRDDIQSQLEQMGVDPGELEGQGGKARRGKRKRKPSKSFTQDPMGWLRRRMRRARKWVLSVWDSYLGDRGNKADL